MKEEKWEYISENLKSRWKFLSLLILIKFKLYSLGGEKNNYKCRDSETA